MSTGTVGQVRNSWQPINDQPLSIGEMDVILFYLPHLVQGVKKATSPPIDTFRGLLPIELITEIDFRQTLDSMIAAGKYDWKNQAIVAEYLPVEGSSKRTFLNQVFHFGRKISSEDAVAAMKREGFTPGGHVHGLAFGATFPDEQRRHSIACLGSPQLVGDRPTVLCLVGSINVRNLDFDQWNYDWDGFWCFLGVKEVFDD